MLKDNENRILLLLKLSPIFLILVSIFISYFIITVNNTKFEKEIMEIENVAMNKRVLRVKQEVQKVYKLIEYEKNDYIYYCLE